MPDPGIISTAELQARGIDRNARRRAIRNGRLIPLARGWYSTGHPHPEALIALRAGARLGCLSGCSFYGLWTPYDQKVHVVYTGSRKPDDSGRLSIHSYRTAAPVGAVWSAKDCLRQVIQNHDTESILIVLESALAQGMISLLEARDLLDEIPSKTQFIRKAISAAESGTETRVRLFLQSSNVAVRSQARIEGLGRVDLLVGESLIIECDSATFHSTFEAYENDRRKDLIARDLGYDTLRLSYQQVWVDWEDTKESILAVIRLRRHHRPPVARKARSGRC